MLRNEKILVVGAGGLLGLRLVKELLKQEAFVIAADRDIENLKYQLQCLSINSETHTLVNKKLDVTCKPQIVRLFEEIDGLTGAVNCCYPRNKNYGKHFFEVEPEDFNENVSMNLGSAFLFMQQCASYFMRKKKPFSLVNISSVYGVIAPKFQVYNGTTMTMPVEYAAIKAGLLHLSKYVASYVKNSGFRVNNVSPGGLLDGQPEAFLSKYKDETFGKGMLDVEDILGSIVFLLSEQSKYINMQNIVVDDGFTR